MNITRKVTVLVLILGVLLCFLITGYTAQREYRLALDDLISSAQARILNRPDLQLYFYGLDKTRLSGYLFNFLQPDSVLTAVAYSNLGEVLAAKNRKNSTPRNIPPLQSLRHDFSISDTSLIAYDRNSKLIGTGFWATLIGSAPTLYLTMPVFSPINPVAKGLGFSDFADASNVRTASNSLMVIGYIHLVIDRNILINTIRPAIGGAFAGSLLFLAFFSMSIYFLTRRTVAPLSQLNQLAHQILSGENVDRISFRENDEYKAIEKVLNKVADGSANQMYEVGLEHKLLEMKADERASQLHLREQELSKAAEEISATKMQLHRLANYDHLTSLPNRLLFMEQLDLLLRLCARNGKPLALLFLNLNNVNRINESLGRSAGDLLLQEVGKRLSGCLRSSDILAHYVDSSEGMNLSRLGDAEFAFALGQLDNIETAGVVAGRIIARLTEPMTIDGHELVLNPSIGIAVAPRNGMIAADLLKHACTAMHHVKSTSGNNFLYFSEEMEARDQDDDLKLEAELRKAISRNEFSLHYQPQVDTNDGSIVCAKALLRWEHPQFGQVSPSRFISIAENSGLISELGDWVLVEACRQMKVFKEQGLELPRIAIFISPQQFKPAFVTRLIEALQSANLPPSILELGLSELILMDNDSDVLKFLQDLKEIGVYLSLENFGTLHAPIGYLSRHPLDEIKIDRSFVADCDKRKDAARLVKAIIAMAKSLNLRAVAEGVETEGEFRFLADNGISIMRGYLFSKPITAAELQQMLVIPWHFMTQIQRMALMAELASSTGS